MLSVPVSVRPRTPPVQCPHPSSHRPRGQRRSAASASALPRSSTGLRWQVREAEGGAQAWTEAQSSAPEALIVDSWLPDLD